MFCNTYTTKYYQIKGGFFGEDIILCNYYEKFIVAILHLTNNGGITFVTIDTHPNSLKDSNANLKMKTMENELRYICNILG
jgi:hypothetical protein